VVPFEGDGETEQLLRARKLSERGLVDIVTEDDLSPGILAASIDRLSSAPKPGQSGLDLNGATGSARFLLDTWRKNL
jgi:predicted glycosyltransferase